VGLDDEAAVVALTRSAGLRFDGDGRLFAGERDLSDAIRTLEMGAAASRVSALPGVRRLLVEEQRRLAGDTDIDGEDDYPTAQGGPKRVDDIFTITLHIQSMTGGKTRLENMDLCERYMTAVLAVVVADVDLGGNNLRPARAACRAQARWRRARLSRDTRRAPPPSPCRWR
jgi:hypothetical protein